MYLVFKNINYFLTKYIRLVHSSGFLILVQTTKIELDFNNILMWFSWFITSFLGRHLGGHWKAEKKWNSFDSNKWDGY